jgi:hypothetical protein
VATSFNGLMMMAGHLNESWQSIQQLAASSEYGSWGQWNLAIHNVSIPLGKLDRSKLSSKEKELVESILGEMPGMMPKQDQA